MAAFIRACARTLGALLLVILAVPLGWQLATGDSYMTVNGESMSPTYELGDVLVLREPAGDELTRIGQIVVATFGTDASDPDAALYVHRVHERTETGAVLKGDNNSEPDPAPITQSQVVGTPRMALTGPVAEGFAFVQSIPGRIVIVMTALLLLWTPIRGRREPAKRHGADRSSTPANPQSPETQELDTITVVARPISQTAQAPSR